MREVWKTQPLHAAVLPPFTSAETVLRWHYADVADMNVSEYPPSCHWSHGDAWDSNSNRGTRTMKEALDFAHHGWQVGADQAIKLREGIEAATPQMPRLARYDVAGAVPSVARAIAGNPMNMRRMAISESRRMPTITLLCDLSVSWRLPARAMIEHATAIAAVADILEGAGYRCEILACDRSGSKTLGLEVVCRAKAPEEVANLSKIAFTLGHAAMLRRLIFAVWQIDQEARPLGTSHGIPQPFKAMPELGAHTTPTAEAVSGTPLQRFIATCNALRAQGCPGIPDAADMPKA